MKKTFWICAAFIAAAVSAAPHQAEAAWTESVLTHFASGSAGSYDGLIADAKGNLYGTNVDTGDYGTVFKLIPPTAGKTAWTRVVLHSFKGADGANPIARVVFDGSGNLYGTTAHGGAGNFGTVFKLAPPAAGKTGWTETVLLSFNVHNGRFPSSGLIFGSDGNLYGTTEYGGPSDWGTVFKLTHPANPAGHWVQTLLHSFTRTDGGEVLAGLVFDTAGNLYGDTYLGGSGDQGLVFELTPPAAGKTAWTETTIHQFTGDKNDGALTEGTLIVDKAGSLYGTASAGGTANEGAIFKLSPPPKGKTAWALSLLYSCVPAAGIYPEGSLTFDAAGNLYGTTPDSSGGDYGTVFKLLKPAAGKTGWTESTLYHFNGTDGANPFSNVIFDKSGNLYGTTSAGGGAKTEGVIFKLTP